MNTEQANHANTATAGLSGPARSTRARSAGGLQSRSAPLPIWFAALVACNCCATSEGEEHPIHWICEADRALYRNCGFQSEWIEALGVRLRCGDTISVRWLPGDTAYTIEVLNSLDCVA